VAAASTVATALVAFFALVLTALFVDRLVELPRPLRPVLPLAALVVPAATLGTLLGLLRRRDSERLAGELDAFSAQSRDVLRSALNLLRRDRERAHPVDAFLLAETVRRAEAFSDTVRPTEVVPWGRAPFRFAEAGALAALFAGLFLWPYMSMDVLLKRLLEPMGNHPRPSLTRIAVSGPLTREVPAGDDVMLEVQLGGVVPEEPQAALHVVSDAREQVVLMTPRPGNRFETELKSVASSATLYVTAGDGRSAMHRIEVIPRPTVVGIRVRYEFPRYTRLPRVEAPLENRQVTAVVGTRVRLDFESSMAVRTSDLVFGKALGGRKLKPRWDKTRRRGSVGFRIERDATFRIHLVGDEGTDNKHDPVYRVRAIQDNPPTVALTEVPPLTSFFRDDVLRLGYKGSDDFGIAEAFLRCRQEPKGDPPLREWSIELPEVNARTAAGSVAVDLGELTDELATGLQVQLVMVDTNGEEGYTPPLRLQIVADGVDRQLQDLLRFQEAYEAQLTATVGGLRAKAGQLGILIDSLDAETALTPKRKEMLRSIDSRLGARPPDPSHYSLMRKGHGPVVFRSFPYAEYPYHSLRKTETCLGSWAVLRSVWFAEQELEAIERSPAPRRQLAEARKQLEERCSEVDMLLAAFGDTVLETRLRVLLLLANKCLKSAAGEDAEPAAGPAASSPERQDGSKGRVDAGLAAELAADKQRERMEAIARLAGQVAGRVEDPTLIDALTALDRARQRPGGQDRAAERAALRKLYVALLTGPDLDGRLGRRVEAYRRSHQLADEVRNARAHGALDLLEEALAMQMRLRRDNYVLNDAELFLSARVYEAIVTGDAGRLEAALGAAARLAGWCLNHDLLDRALLLHRGIRRLSEDHKLGRLRLDSPEFDVRWQLTRELFVSLTRDHNAGRFTELSAAVREELAKLDSLRAALGPGEGERFLTDPACLEAREALARTTSALIASLRPVVARDAALALAQTGELLRDLAANLRAESRRVRAEVEAIDRETGPQVPDPRDREAFREIMKEAQRPTPGRERFSEIHAERMACHAIALAKVLDVRQLSGKAMGPDPETAATNILAEYLAHLEEHTYDKVVAIYKTAYGTPVIFAVAARQFYREAAPGLARLGEWVELLAADRGAELLDVAEYAELLRGVHKDSRHRAAMASLASHRAFVQSLDAARTREARRLALHAMLGREDEALAYWQLLRLALGEFSERVQEALRVVSAPTPRELTPGERQRLEAELEGIRWILPAPEASPAETKGLPGLLDEFAERVGCVGAGTERQAAIEDLETWHGRLLAAMQGVDARVARPPMRYRPRLRYQRRSRTDLEHRLGGILRNEARWSRRVAEAGWDSLASRARGLVGAAGRDEICWLAALEQTCRRKSAAATAQQSRALDLETEEPDERFLKMPLYLYKELRRAMGKPYPTQFKEPALQYMRGLVNDAR